jgi:mono/diheme cytochrome c family protein
MARPFIAKAKKVAGWGFSILLTTAAILITVTVGWRPVVGAKSRPLADRHFERTPERLARGKYLVEGVASCFDCHAEIPSELKPGEAPEFRKKGAGRVVINEGSFVLAAPNITPDIETGAGTWTDDQFARAIREGIGHDGRTLFPMMPYQQFRYLSDEDLASIVVYIHSLDPVHNVLPQRQIPFPLSRLINTAPEPLQGPVEVNVSDSIARGRYLTKVGNCEYCHTPTDKTDHPLPGMQFAGGKQVDPQFPAVSANITPDATGISYYDEALFIRTLRTGHVGARALNPPMPWWNFRNMTDDDLKAIFAYLRTVKPVHHRVDNSEAASKCKKCNGRHGAGEGNAGL